MKIAVVLTAHCLVALSCAWPVSESPHSVPIRLTEGGLLLVEVSVDHSKGQFILDTGAGIHVLSRSFLEKIPSVGAGRFTGFRHNGERVDFDLYTIPCLSVGPFQQRSPLVGVWGLLDNWKIAGVLSAQFFESKPITLDVSDQQLIFETESSLTKRRDEGATVALAIRRDRDKSTELFVNMDFGESVRGECELDTGLDGYILDARFMDALRINKQGDGVRREEVKSLFGGLEVQYRTTIPTIALAGRPDVAVSEPQVVFEEHLIYDCVIGTDFWRGRRVTLDIANGRLIVARQQGPVHSRS